MSSPLAAVPSITAAQLPRSFLLEFEGHFDQTANLVTADLPPPDLTSN